MKLFWILLSMVVLFNIVEAKPGIIENSLAEIDACEGKIMLTLVRTWGGDEIDDENQFLRFPSDIKISQKDRQVYIVDSALNRIQVFDREGKYIRTIGQGGQGPGDLLQPLYMDIDRDNNLVVCDDGNYRIQVFDPTGKSLSIFKYENANPSYLTVNNANEIILFISDKAKFFNTLLFVFSHKGELIRKIGKIHNRKKSGFEPGEFAFIDSASDDSIIALFMATPYYREYSSRGDVLMTVTYQISQEVPRLKWDNSRENVINGDIYNEQSAAGLSIDDKDRVYFVAVTRPPKQSERFFLTDTGVKYPKRAVSFNTDRYRLLVFSPGGKIIAAKKLDVFCDNIYIFEDHLFIVDTYMGMIIYEYKVSLKP